MDYIVKRLEKVIAGEDGGISKEVEWQGGGSFVYCELAKLNQTIVEETEAAKDEPPCPISTEGWSNPVLSAIK